MPSMRAADVQPGFGLIMNHGGNVPRHHRVVNVQRTQGAPTTKLVPTTEKVSYKDVDWDGNQAMYYRSTTKEVGVYPTPKIAITFETGEFTGTGAAKTRTHHLPPEMRVIVA